MASAQVSTRFAAIKLWVADMWSAKKSVRHCAKLKGCLGGDGLPLLSHADDTSI